MSWLAPVCVAARLACAEPVQWLADLLNTEPPPFPERVHLTFETLELFVLDKAEFAALERRIKGKVDHPDRARLERFQRRIDRGPDKARWVYAEAEGQWVLARLYLDDVPLVVAANESAAWWFSPGTLTIRDRDTPLPPHIDGHRVKNEMRNMWLACSAPIRLVCPNPSDASVRAAGPQSADLVFPSGWFYRVTFEPSGGAAAMPVIKSLVPFDDRTGQAFDAMRLDLSGWKEFPDFGWAATEVRWRATKVEIDRVQRLIGTSVIEASRVRDLTATPESVPRALSLVVEYPQARVDRLRVQDVRSTQGGLAAASSNTGNSQAGLPRLVPSPMTTERIVGWIVGAFVVLGGLGWIGYRRAAGRVGV